MLKNPNSAPSKEITRTPVEGEVAQRPEGPKPWEDRSLSPGERKEAYAALVQDNLEAIAGAFDRAKEAQDVATQKEIMNSPETKRWMEEGTWLQSASAEEFCERIDRTEVIKLLGKNFLGAAAWEAQGIAVEEEPPLPQGITRLLLESDCPFQPGEKIKGTHLLVLMPKTVNGEAYSARQLEELCETRKRAGRSLMYDRYTSWRSQPWASAPQAESEWVLLPKREPDPKKVAAEKHFRNKDMAEQQQVRDHYYAEYRDAKTVELITAVILYDLVNREQLLKGQYRCQEPNLRSCGRVWVGRHSYDLGLWIDAEGDDDFHLDLGLALARKV